MATTELERAQTVEAEENTVRLRVHNRMVEIDLRTRLMDAQMRQAEAATRQSITHSRWFPFQVVALALVAGAAIATALISYGASMGAT